MTRKRLGKISSNCSYVGGAEGPPDIAAIAIFKGNFHPPTYCQNFTKIGQKSSQWHGFEICEISKNSQGRNFSQNSWGGTYLKATFSQLPCVKISSKSVKRSSSYIDLKFSRSSLACVCSALWRDVRRLSKSCAVCVIQQKSDELRFNGHALHSHTNARLDLENFKSM